MSETNELKSKTKILLELILKDCRDSTSLPQIFVHGDFTPWNIKKIENGSLMALDWEMGDTNGLPFMISFIFSSSNPTFLMINSIQIEFLNSCLNIQKNIL